jgi:hypothetical protein
MTEYLTALLRSFSFRYVVLLRRELTRALAGLSASFPKRRIARVTVN